MRSQGPLAGNCVPVSYGTIQPVMLQPAVCNVEAPQTYRAPYLPTMPRRQMLIQRVKLPEIPKPQWPITRQYSQCIQDLSLASTTPGSNYGSCNCNRCSERKRHCSCGSCNHCQTTDRSCAAPVSVFEERSCAAPMNVFAERSCAAPECVLEQSCSAPASAYYTGGQSMVSQGSVYCESCGKVHSSETRSAETPENNFDSQVAVPPPAPLPAPPPIEDSVQKKASSGSSAQQPKTPPSSQNAAQREVPLPEVTPESTPLPEVTTPMPNAEELPIDATLPAIDPEPAPEPTVAPMPILELMSLQVPSSERNRTAFRRSVSHSVETETITVQPTAVTRKRVQ